MKKNLHPEYRPVLFHDTAVDQYFLIRSTLKTTQTKKWEDGKTYPYYTVVDQYFLINSTLETTQTKEWEDGKTYPYFIIETSSASHPFYTGQQRVMDTGGRVQRFEKKFGKKG